MTPFSHRRVPLFFALAWVALSLGAMDLLHPGDFPPEPLDFWRPSAGETQALAELHRRRLASLPPQESWSPLVDSYLRANQAQAGQAPGKASSFEHRFASQAAGFIAGQGADSYVAVGGYLLTRLMPALTEVASSLRQERLPLVRWLERHGDDPHLVSVRALSGAFLERAVGAGLLGPGTAPDRDRLLVAGALWMEHWLVAAGTDRLRPSAEEARLIWRWKVEEAHHLDLGRRLALLASKPPVDPAYPALLVTAVHLAAAGDPDAALACLEEALGADPLSTRSRRWLASFRRQALWPAF